MLLYIQQRQAGDITILDVSGSLVFGETFLLTNVITRLLQENYKRKILLSLTSVNYLDFWSVQELGRCAKWFAPYTALHGELNVVIDEKLSAVEPVQAILSLVFHGVSVFPNEGVALWSFR